MTAQTTTFVDEQTTMNPREHMAASVHWLQRAENAPLHDESMRCLGIANCYATLALANYTRLLVAARAL